MKILAAIEEQKTRLKSYRNSLYSLLLLDDLLSTEQKTRILIERTDIRKYIDGLTEVEKIIYAQPYLNIDLEDLTEFNIEGFLDMVPDLIDDKIREILASRKK